MNLRYIETGGIIKCQLGRSSDSWQPFFECYSTIGKKLARVARSLSNFWEKQSRTSLPHRTRRPISKCKHASPNLKFIARESNSTYSLEMCAPVVARKWEAFRSTGKQHESRQVGVASGALPAKCAYSSSDINQSHRRRLLGIHGCLRCLDWTAPRSGGSLFPLGFWSFWSLFGIGNGGFPWPGDGMGCGDFCKCRRGSGGYGGGSRWRICSLPGCRADLAAFAHGEDTGFQALATDLLPQRWVLGFRVWAILRNLQNEFTNRGYDVRCRVT